MKKGYSPIQLIGEILLILLVLLTLIAIISPTYRETFVNGIKKIFGYEIESEVLHEKNIQAEEEFGLIENNLEKCKNSKKTECGCSFNVKNFNENHMIISTNSEIRMINKGKIERKEILKDLSKGTLIKKFDVANTNCFFNDKLNMISTAKIFFDKPEPYLYEKRGWIFVKDEITINKEYPLYKSRERSICWLSSNVQNIKSC